MRLEMNLIFKGHPEGRIKKYFKTSQIRGSKGPIFTYFAGIFTYFHNYLPIDDQNMNLERKIGFSNRQQIFQQILKLPTISSDSKPRPANLPRGRFVRVFLFFNFKYEFRIAFFLFCIFLSFIRGCCVRGVFFSQFWSCLWIVVR